ncbi:MAG: response regulator [Nitrososphaeraceae archaeon]|jgi:CheY-like chemotaxis protein|nr:response regulator [Nitrososphaeraceae archaeon]
MQQLVICLLMAGLYKKSQAIPSENLSPFAKRILIVDDDPDITFTLKKGLEAENDKNGNKTLFKVDSHNNPLKALSEFKPDFYDLILIDINMPKMDGWNFLPRY